MAADRVIRWSTAAAVIGVAAVAAAASYEHAYGLVRVHGESGWTARLVPFTVDGLICASSIVMLDAARWRRGQRWLWSGRSTRLPYMSSKRAWRVMMTSCIPSLASSLAGRWARCVLTAPRVHGAATISALDASRPASLSTLRSPIGDRRCEAPSTRSKNR